MSAKIIQGKEIAAQMRSEMAAEVQQLRHERGLVPGLAVILVGDDPASVSYVRGKRQACEQVGIQSLERHFPAHLTDEDLLAVVDELNHDERVHGILIQLPLPGQDEGRALNAVSPDKDVDGLHPVNLGRLMRGEEGFLPCTPFAVQQMLVRTGVDVEGKHVVVVGRSTLVGRPLANMLTQKRAGGNATVTVCHTRTQDLASFTRQADVLVVAAGRPATIDADMVREGAVVIDVGVNRVEDTSRKRGFRLVGDVDFESVKERASAITPVPGGVGPMTITMLLYNTIWSCKRSHGLL